MKERSFGTVSMAETTAVPPGIDAPIRHYTEETRRALLVAPVVLIAMMYVVFHLADRLTSTQLALDAGFAIYWLVWGIGVPFFVFGRRGLADLLLSRDPARHRLPWKAAVLLAVPPIVAFLVVFPALFPGPRDVMMLTLAGYALVNGVLEEVFWRGLYARVFPTEMWRGLIYPAAMYGAWLLVPLTLSSPWSFTDAAVVFSAGFAVGLLYGWVAWRTGSIRWTMLSHVMMNLGGIGALIFSQL